MSAITKVLAGGVAMAALACAAPAAAQFFPGMGDPYGYGYPGYGYGNPGYGYGNPGYGGYGYTPGGSRIAANQCSAAVQQRLGGYGAGYGYEYGAGNGRVVGIESVEIRPAGGYRVRGTATAGGYAYGGGGGPVRFSCSTDPRGLVIDVRFNNDAYGNGYYGNPYSNGGYGSDYDNPYSVYGYQRY